MVRILIVDSYDSFTYNLAHLVERISGEKPDVFFNDKIHWDRVAEYDAIVLSPGPGLPSEAGELLTLIKKYAGRKPMLGVCLGHQAIAVAFGGKLKNLTAVHHGVAHDCTRTASESVLLKGLPESFPAGRYHSWVVDETSLPAGFLATSKDPDGVLMSMEHRTLGLCSVQFHPESILTPYGEAIMRNWVGSIVVN